MSNSKLDEILAKVDKLEKSDKEQKSKLNDIYKMLKRIGVPEDA